MIANVLMKKGLCYSTVKNVGIITSENYVYKRRRMFGKVSRLETGLTRVVNDPNRSSAKPYGGSGFRLNDEPNLKLSSLGHCHVLVIFKGVQMMS